MMAKSYMKPYQELDWFTEAMEKGDDAFKEFFEALNEELIELDMSIYSYLETYITSGYFVPNMINLLKNGSLPQVFLIHKFTFISTEMSEWYEWYCINKGRKLRVTQYNKEYIDKWLGEHEPNKPADFSGLNKYREVRRKMSRGKWLVKAWEMGL